MTKSFVLLMIVACATLGSQGQPYRLEDCQTKARANYPLIRQYDLIDQSAEYTIANANKAYLPKLSLTGIGAYVIKGVPSIANGDPGKSEAQFIGIAQLNQTIWDGGATKTQKNITKAGAEVDKAELDVALHALSERVNQLFFGILLLDEQQKLARILHENLARNLKAVSLSKENGLAYSSDEDEVQVEMLKQEQRLAELEHVRAGYSQMLLFMIGAPTESELELVKPAVFETPAVFTLRRPELRLYDLQQKQVETQSRMIQVNNAPKIGLLGAGLLIEPGVTLGFANIKSLALAGVSVSWSTTGVYTSASQKQLIRLSQERIQNQREVFLFNTNLELTRQQNDIDKQKVILAKDENIVQLRASIKSAYELKYRNGICSMNDLINATQGEHEAMANRALHQAQLWLAQATYQTTSGY